MALPFLNGRSKKKDQLIAIDLGARTTKAILVQRKGDNYSLLRYVLMDAPIYEKSLSADLLGEHLRAVGQALEANTKFVSLALGVNDSLIRHADLPQIPVDDMRLILKNSPKNYLQQDLPGHVFDCYVLANSQAAKPADGQKPAGGPQKQKVLVGGARRQLVEDLQTAIKDAGLIADQVIPGPIGPVNAFEMAMPEIFKKDVVALVDLGFHNTTICLVADGELVLSRVVNLGGDKLTAGVAEALNISYAEAEGIKVGMPTEVQSNLEAVLIPLGRELRASIDFFEHQYDRTVSQVFMSGGASRSEFVVQLLQSELMSPCQSWNPTGFMQLAMPPQQMAEHDQVAPQLAVAIGVAVASLD